MCTDQNLAEAPADRAFKALVIILAHPMPQLIEERPVIRATNYAVPSRSDTLPR